MNIFRDEGPGFCGNIFFPFVSKKKNVEKERGSFLSGRL